MTATEPMSDANTTNWNEQFAALKNRFPHVRDPILVAMHILTQAPNITPDDAKAQASLHGVRITAASLAGAQCLLAKQDAPAATTNGTTVQTTAPANTAPKRPARRVRGSESALDAESMIRDVVERLQRNTDERVEQMRMAIRKAIEVLQPAVE